MDVAAIASLQQAQTLSQVQLAVARKVNDQQKLQGDAAIKLLQAAANLQQQPLDPTGVKGSLVDITV